MGIGSWISENIGSPVGDFVNGVGDWLGNRSGGPTSKAPDLDRSDFNLAGQAGRDAFTSQQAAGAQGRQAPQAADSSFRGDQQDLINRLRGQMSGQDSLSALQLRDATDANIAQQRSQAASASPGNAAMMQRLAAQNTGRMNQGYGAQAAQLGIQERNAAANALAGVAQGARGQDLQNNQFNTQAQLQQRGMNDAYTQGMAGLNLGNAQAGLQGSMGYAGQQTARRGQDLAVPQQPQNWERVVGAAGAVAPFFMADGGLVTQPTDAVVGEAGPEMVLPLSKLPDLVAATGARAASDKSTSTALQGLQKLSQGNGGGDDWRQGVVDASAKMSSSSSDPLVKGLGAIAGAYAAHQKKGKDAQAMQSSLATQATRPAAQVKTPTASGLGDYMKQDALAGQTYDPGYTMMAQGGVVTEPTRAVVGEAGPEVVIPLHKLPGLLERLGVAARTKQTASSSPAPAPSSLYARPDELSRARQPVVRPEELYRARTAELPPPRAPGPPSTGSAYLQQLRMQGNR